FRLSCARGGAKLRRRVLHRNRRHAAFAYQLNHLATPRADGVAIGARARAGKNERLHPMRVAAPHRERDATAHRKAGDHGALDANRIEKRGEVVGVLVHGVRRGGATLAEPTHVHRHAPVDRRQRVHLRRPQRPIMRESMHEQQRRTARCTGHVVLEVYIGESAFHWCRPSSEAPAWAVCAPSLTLRASNVSQYRIVASVVCARSMAAANAFAPYVSSRMTPVARSSRPRTSRAAPNGRPYAPP